MVATKKQALRLRSGRTESQATDFYAVTDSDRHRTEVRRAIEDRRLARELGIEP